MNEMERFWRQVDVRGTVECWPWVGATDSSGYGRFRVGGRAGHQVAAHRYSLELTREVPPGAHVLHSCDMRACVNPAHLRPGTHAANMRDMAVRERSRTTKLTAAAVLEIRALARSGVSGSTIARNFGVSKSNVQAIASRATWRHLP